MRGDRSAKRVGENSNRPKFTQPAYPNYIRLHPLNYPLGNVFRKIIKIVPHFSRGKREGLSGDKPPVSRSISCVDRLLEPKHVVLG
jgi:hypothetical protein